MSSHRPAFGGRIPSIVIRVSTPVRSTAVIKSPQGVGCEAVRVSSTFAAPSTNISSIATRIDPRSGTAFSAAPLSAATVASSATNVGVMFKIVVKL